jgi:hypothetical protein
VSHLARDDVHRPLDVLVEAARGGERHGVADGRERVPQLVGEHGQELVFPPVVLAEQFGLPLNRLLGLPLGGHVARRAEPFDFAVGVEDGHMALVRHSQQSAGANSGQPPSNRSAPGNGDMIMPIVAASAVASEPAEIDSNGAKIIF